MTWMVRTSASRSRSRSAVAHRARATAGRARRGIGVSSPAGVWPPGAAVAFAALATVRSTRSGSSANTAEASSHSAGPRWPNRASAASTARPKAGDVAAVALEDPAEPLSHPGAGLRLGLHALGLVDRQAGEVEARQLVDVAAEVLPGERLGVPARRQLADGRPGGHVHVQAVAVDAE